MEIDNGDNRTAILTGGLPFHRLHGLRMLDSVLLARGERAREFTIGIGVDLTHPLHEATSLMMPSTTILQTAAAPQAANSAWLFHLDNKAVIATNWTPLLEEGQVRGFKVRLLETHGRPARVSLSCFQAVESAQQVDFCGEVLTDCQIDEGRVRFELTGHEWTEVVARWA